MFSDHSAHAFTPKSLYILRIDGHIDLYDGVTPGTAVETQSIIVTANPPMVPQTPELRGSTQN